MLKMIKPSRSFYSFFYLRIISEKVQNILEYSRIFQNILEYSRTFQNILIIPRVHWLSVQLIVQSKTGLGKIWLSVKNMYTINSTYSEH